MESLIHVRPPPANVGLDHPSLYFNQEVGWLDFTARVLHQARDGRQPLLERVRFLAIASQNLDEFYQRRVGGLKRQKASGLVRLSYDGRTPDEQLCLSIEGGLRLHREMTQIWEDEIRPLIRKDAGILISDYKALDERQKEAVDAYFIENIYPVLTPLAVDPGHPFPFISNLSISLAVGMRHPDHTHSYFARVKVPTTQGRWVPVPDSNRMHHYVPIEQIIARNVGNLFRGMKITSVHPFRVTRNADVARDEEEAEDLVSMIAEELQERRYAPVVRLEIDRKMPKKIRRLLLRELELAPEDFVEVDGTIALSDLHDIASIEAPAHSYEPWVPVVPPTLAHLGDTGEGGDIFSVLRRGDLLVHHPYESFNATVQRLLDDAADDPDVLAIKQTLYRTSANSPVVRALLRAAERGKQVAVLIEVTARFDEANNIEWANLLENAGVHVAYGLIGLKTHAKALLVIRNEDGEPVPYCHIGTGNYHAGTAQIYSDLGLFTSRASIGRDVIQLFHSLTGHSPEQSYEEVLVAPRSMRRIFYELIRREVEHQARKGNGRIIAKMNGLDDPGIIQELYAASQAGVQIDLIVRGPTRLRPGLPGYSDNIRVVSIVGRFLEHDRIYYFGNGGAPEIIIGSPDWRQRNLSDRIELAVPVKDEQMKRRLTTILELALLDNRLAFDLDAQGVYRQRTPPEDAPEVNLQDALMSDAQLRSEAGRTWDMSE